MLASNQFVCMTVNIRPIISLVSGLLASAGAMAAAEIPTSTDSSYYICVSNERADSISILDGNTATTSGTAAVLATVPVGKRPRGIEASPDGKLLYVALSGSPIMGPPKLDAEGNPIEIEVEEDDVDHSQDGIGVVDLADHKFLRKLPAGSDPEEFAVSKDGRRLYVANEDVGTMSVMKPETGQVEAIVQVEEEPEGVTLNPDGSRVYVTCETRGEVFVIDTGSNKPVAEFTVGGRPRSTAFSPDGSLAYVPSETTGKIHVVDTDTYKTTAVVTLPPGSRPMGLVMSPDGKTLYASTGRGGTVVAVDAENFGVLKSIKVGTRPWGIDISPDGKLLFTANGPSNDVSVVDITAGTEVARIPTDSGPWGITVVQKVRPQLAD